MSFKLDGTKFRAFTDAGLPLAGGTLNTYASGTTTNKATYTDATLGSANTNPIVLDARGEADVWLGSGAYTFLLKTSAGVTVDTVDGVVDPQAAAQSGVLALLASTAAGEGAELSGFDWAVLYSQSTAGWGVRTAAQGYNIMRAIPPGDWAALAAGTYSGADLSGTINTVLAAHKEVIFPEWTFPHAAQIVMQEGQVLHLGAAVFKPSSALAVAAWTASSKTGIRIYGGTFDGVGTAFSTGNEHLMTLVSCSGVRLYGTTFTHSRNEGLRLDTCSDVVVDGCRAVANYGSGFQDRDGTGNRWIAVHGVGNGTTGVATGTGGRGLLIFRGFDIQVIGGRFATNTEYGLRVYSQSGDATGSAYIKIIGAHAEDNTVIDFYVYNDGGAVAQVTFRDCTVRRTTDPTGVCVALQGTAIVWDGGSVTKIGTRMAVAMFQLYGLSRSAVRGVTCTNAGQWLGWSATAVCDDVTVSGNIVECATVGALVGTKVSFRQNKFKHGGSGTTDISIDAGSTYSPVIDGNEFDGFYRNINWVAQAMTLRGNTSRNTTDVSLRMNGDGIANLVHEGNDWDVNSNPVYVGTSSCSGGPNARGWHWDSAVPASGTFPRGWTIEQNTSAVGSFKRLKKVTVGAANVLATDWISEGVL